MAWKAEVQADDSNTWVGNALVFETEPEAAAYVADLSHRWWLVHHKRTVETTATVNARWDFELGKITSPL